MNTAPKDEPILLYGEGHWYEGQWGVHDLDRFEPIRLDYHGCGCCGGSPPIPEGWMPLPSNVVEVRTVQRPYTTDNVSVEDVKKVLTWSDKDGSINDIIKGSKV